MILEVILAVLEVSGGLFVDVLGAIFWKFWDFLKNRFFGLFGGPGGPGAFKIVFRILKYPGGLIYSFRS